MKYYNINWPDCQKLDSKSYKCGHCGENVSSENGFVGTGTFYTSGTRSKSMSERIPIYICHFCNCPTMFIPHQVPAPAFGKKILGLPTDEIKILYGEARDCFKVNAYTASVMCSRKLLMNIAVAEDAKEGLNFIDYVKFLENSCLPPRANALAEHVRKKGNEANHEIRPQDEDTAKELITFIEMILTLLYEFPARMNQASP